MSSRVILEKNRIDVSRKRSASSSSDEVGTKAKRRNTCSKDKRKKSRHRSTSSNSSSSNTFNALKIHDKNKESKSWSTSKSNKYKNESGNKSKESYRHSDHCTKEKYPKGHSNLNPSKHYTFVDQERHDRYNYNLCNKRETEKINQMRKYKEVSQDYKRTSQNITHSLDDVNARKRNVSESSERKTDSLHLKKKKRRRSSSSSSSTTSSSSSSSSTSSDNTSTDSSSDTSEDERKRRREKRKAKKLKRAAKKRKKKEMRMKKKLHKKKKPKMSSVKDKQSEMKEKKKHVLPELTEKANKHVLPELTERAKAMAPMTKEEWEKKQSMIRRVYDEETGRIRLIKGDGEVMEEIVSRQRHKEINRQATKGDGEYFQTHLKLDSL